MPNLRRFTPWLLLALAALACNIITPSSTPTPQPATPPAGPTGTALPAATDTPAPTGRPAATATQPPIPTRAATSPTTLKLSDGGPWLVFSAEDGLWAANADGSGLTRVMPAKPFFRLGLAAPSGGHVVVLTGSDPEGIHNLTLWLLTLPGGDVKPIAALTSASTEPPATVTPGDTLDVLFPLGQAAWSPDGANLAFIGAQAGPSDDLFSYNVASGQVTRLTDGPSQAYGPSWSPDGRYIVQMGAQTFGTGAGFTMEGVWAAAADNSGVKLLYKPTSGGEDVLGWVRPEAFEVTSFYVSCSNGKVRSFDIATGRVEPIFDGFYSQLAADPASGIALVAVDQFVAACDTNGQQGLFLARPGAAPKLLDAQSGGAAHLGWSPEAGLFYASTNAGWVGYTPSGQQATLPKGLSGEPVVAPGGKNWAWIDQPTGLLQVSVDGGASQNASRGDALHPTWSPHGQTLLFFSGDRLYAAGGDFSQPQAAAQAVTVADTDSVEWVKR